MSAACARHLALFFLCAAACRPGAASAAGASAATAAAGARAVQAEAPARAIPAEAAAADEAEGDPAIEAIRFYQRYLSSLRHTRCRFTPSCSEYAAQAIAAYGLTEGSARAADRLMRCNASASGAYPRDARGSLADPVEGAGPAASLRVPRWLLLPPEPDDPPAAERLAPAARSRLSETLEFARVLERRGDCAGAATEYQRAGMLADTAAADAWAFARAGGCYFASSQWLLAERAYLSAALLATGEHRAAAAYSAAASRFNAGSFAACGRLLDDPALAAGPRVATLSGLCAFAGGDWPRARDRFAGAAAAGDRAIADRSLRLSAFAAEGPALPRRSPGWAGALSAILPGAGQAYCGRVEDGVRHLLFNGALIYSVVLLAQGDNVPAAVIVGGVTLPFYVGNVIGARETARRFNRQRRIDLMERALAESSR